MTVPHFIEMDTVGHLTPDLSTWLFGEIQFSQPVTVTEVTPMSLDESLVERAQKGDPQAFREIVERHQNSVIHTVTGMLGSDPEVDDVVQQVFIRFYTTLQSFRGQSSCRTYLTRIAINASLDALRRRKRMFSRFVSRDDETVGVSDPIADDHLFDRFDRAQLIHSAMNALKSHQRAVVVLRLIDGYSTAETALILGIAEGTVLSRLSRGTRHLRKLLGPILEEEKE
ncbi:MAG: RNA polymerase sigma factor [Bacteroidetes bacterium]|nr:RNA polymerase sigma factor [Bacteroidota bacterium]